MVFSLNIEKREKIGKTHSLKKEGLMPAVFYGHKKESTPIQIKKSDFIKVWKNAGESAVIKLQGFGADIEALIKDVDIDPVSGEPRHADFYVFEKGHKVELALPIEFTGISPAVKDLGGILVKVMHEIRIKADPSNIPHSIEVDISPLVDFNSQILAKNIKLPSGIELVEDEEEVVALVSEAKEEKTEEEKPVDLSQIEVEKKGKQEEGEVETTTH